jgi:hypothetical protein
VQPGHAPATPIVIDTFEQTATGVPEDARFGIWTFYAYNPSMQGPGDFVSSGITGPGFGSNYAIELNWQVTDVADGKPNYPGVGLKTDVSGYIDLTAYDRFVFDQQYSNPDNCESLMNIEVIFVCSELHASFSASVPVSSQWSTSTIDFTSLVPPDGAPPPASIGDCFKVIDTIIFQEQIDLPDGACASGSLLLDDIEIR